ncbi:MAG: DeoR/GlpR family DNA-binding transcription regulator [Spirochaetaceae bacterium]
MNTPSAQQRLLAIASHLERDGKLRVADLAERLGVSEMTIRRDLRELERQGLVRRVHGGAVLELGRSYEPPLVARMLERLDQKRKIGRRAAQMIGDGESVSLDIGSTTMELARAIDERRNITVLTPSLPVAEELLERPGLQLLMPGGTVRPGERSLVGDVATEFFRRFFVDRLFLSIGGVDGVAGLTEFNPEDAAVKRAMLSGAKQVVLLADSAKFERVVFRQVASLAVVDILVTDAMPEGPLAEALKLSDVVIDIAP